MSSLVSLQGFVDFPYEDFNLITAEKNAIQVWLRGQVIDKTFENEQDKLEKLALYQQELERARKVFNEKKEVNSASSSIVKTKTLVFDVCDLKFIQCLENKIMIELKMRLNPFVESFTTNEEAGKTFDIYHKRVEQAKEFYYNHSNSDNPKRKIKD